MATITIDGGKLKRVLFLIVWLAVAACVLLVSMKFLPSVVEGDRHYATLDISSLITKERERIAKESFMLGQPQTEESINAQSIAYFNKLKTIVSAIAAQENIVVLDASAVLGYPQGALIDITPMVSAKLNSGKQAQ